MLKQIDLINRTLCGIQGSQTDAQMADFPAVVVTVKQKQRMLQQYIRIIGVGMDVGGTNGIGKIKITDTDGYQRTLDMLCPCPQAQRDRQALQYGFDLLIIRNIPIQRCGL